MPTEQVQEHIEHHAQMSAEKWVSAVALSTAILAALGAVAALLGGDHANHGMLDEIKAANQWSYFQAKSIKSGLLTSKGELLQALGQTPSQADKDKLAEYAKEQNEIREKAEQKEKAAEAHLHAHVILARGVTLFQIAIAVGAISVLTKRRMFWGVSLVFGLVGLVFLVQGILSYRG